MREARQRLDNDQPVADSSRTVADYVAHWRATTLAVQPIQHSTRSLYDSMARKHIEPAPFGAGQGGGAWRFSVS